MFTKKSIFRFAKYATVGVGTFLFDLGILFVLNKVYGVHYVLAAGIGFLIAVSLNYVLSRKFAFKGTERGLMSGYLMFLGIVGSGLAFLTVAMYVCVDIFGFPVLVSRVLIAGVVGCWNYLMNLYVNFKVAGK